MTFPEDLPNHLLSTKIGLPEAFAGILAGRRPNRRNLAWRNPPLKMGVFATYLFPVRAARASPARPILYPRAALLQGALRIQLLQL